MLSTLRRRITQPLSPDISSNEGGRKDEGCVERITHMDHSLHRMAEWPLCVASVAVPCRDGSTQIEESRRLLRHERSTDEHHYRAHPEWAFTNLAS